MKKLDVIVVGAGPCGLACAIEAKKSGLSVLILEKGTIANSIWQYPKEMRFFSTTENISIGGLPFNATQPKASRNEALVYYRHAVEFFGLNLQLNCTVQQVKKGGQVFNVLTSKGDFQADKVILATGYFDQPRTLGIEGEDLPQVKSYYDEPYPYAFQDVVIIGGGNSAIEAALDLYRHAARVSVVIRGETLKPTAKYWLKPDIENRIKEGSIAFYPNSMVKAIRASSVVVDQQGASLSLPADAVFSLIGYLPDTELFKACGVEFDPGDCVPAVNEHSLESNIPGLYLGGTVIAGVHTEKVFIENGRAHAQKIVEHVLSQKKKS